MDHADGNPESTADSVQLRRVGHAEVEAPGEVGPDSRGPDAGLGPESAFIARVAEPDQNEASTPCPRSSSPEQEGDLNPFSSARAAGHLTSTPRGCSPVPVFDAAPHPDSGRHGEDHASAGAESGDGAGADAPAPVLGSPLPQPPQRGPEPAPPPPPHESPPEGAPDAPPTQYRASSATPPAAGREPAATEAREEAAGDAAAADAAAGPARLFFAVDRSLAVSEVHAALDGAPGLLSCDLKCYRRDGRSKGYGFALFASHSLAHAAISLLDGAMPSETSKFPLRVMWAQESPPRREKAPDNSPQHGSGRAGGEGEGNTAAPAPAPQPATPTHRCNPSPPASPQAPTEAAATTVPGGEPAAEGGDGRPQSPGTRAAKEQEALFAEGREGRVLPDTTCSVGCDGDAVPQTPDAGPHAAGEDTAGAQGGSGTARSSRGTGGRRRGRRRPRPKQGADAGTGGTGREPPRAKQRGSGQTSAAGAPATDGAAAAAAPAPAANAEAGAAGKAASPERSPQGVPSQHGWGRVGPSASAAQDSHSSQRDPDRSLEPRLAHRRRWEGSAPGSGERHSRPLHHHHHHHHHHVHPQPAQANPPSRGLLPDAGTPVWHSSGRGPPGAPWVQGPVPWGRWPHQGPAWWAMQPTQPPPGALWMPMAPPAGWVPAAFGAPAAGQPPGQWVGPRPLLGTPPRPPVHPPPAAVLSPAAVGPLPHPNAQRDDCVPSPPPFPTAEGQGQDVGGMPHPAVAEKGLGGASPPRRPRKRSNRGEADGEEVMPLDSCSSDSGNGVGATRRSPARGASGGSSAGARGSSTGGRGWKLRRRRGTAATTGGTEPHAVAAALRIGPARKRGKPSASLGEAGLEPVPRREDAGSESGCAAEKRSRVTQAAGDLLVSPVTSAKPPPVAAAAGTSAGESAATRAVVPGSGAAPTTAMVAQDVGTGRRHAVLRMVAQCPRAWGRAWDQRHAASDTEVVGTVTRSLATLQLAAGAERGQQRRVPAGEDGVAQGRDARVGTEARAVDGAGYPRSRHQAAQRDPAQRGPACTRKRSRSRSGLEDHGRGSSSPGGAEAPASRARPGGAAREVGAGARRAEEGGHAATAYDSGAASGFDADHEDEPREQGQGKAGWGRPAARALPAPAASRPDAATAGGEGDPRIVLGPWHRRVLRHGRRRRRRRKQRRRHQQQGVRPAPPEGPSSVE